MKLKLKLKRVLALNAALRDLNGREEIAKDENGKVLGIVVKPYVFDDANVRYGIARTLKHIRNEVESYDDARIGVIGKYSKGKAEVSKDHPEFLAMQKELLDLQAKEVDVMIHGVRLEHLKAHDNKLDGALLLDLEPWLLDGGFDKPEG